MMRYYFYSLLLPAALWAQHPTPKQLSTDQRITSLATRIKSTPEDAVVRIELAGAYLQKMRETTDGAYLERARQLVDGTLRQHPDDYDARRRALEIEMMVHHFKQVVAGGGKLLAERPHDATVLGLVGDAHMERGDYDRASDAYQKMSDLRPGLASYNRIAFYRFVTGDPVGAIEAMRLAIRAGSREPENLAWCLTDLGMMLFKTGAINEAERAFREALNRFPGYHPALGGIGRAEAARGHNEAAIRSILAAQSRVPLPEYAGLLAKLYRKTGQTEAASRQLALLDVAGQLDKAAGELANRHLALAYADLEYRLPRALELARAELAVREDVYTYDALAWILFRNGQAAPAAEAIGKALAQNTPEPAFHAHAAAIYESLGRMDDAAASRKQAAALNPTYDIR